MPTAQNYAGKGKATTHSPQNEQPAQESGSLAQSINVPVDSQLFDLLRKRSGLSQVQAFTREWFTEYLVHADEGMTVEYKEEHLYIYRSLAEFFDYLQTNVAR